MSLRGSARLGWLGGRRWWRGVGLGGGEGGGDRQLEEVETGRGGVLGKSAWHQERARGLSITSS